MIFRRLLLTLGFAAALAAAVDTHNLRAVFRSGDAVSGWEKSACTSIVSNIAKSGRDINTMKILVYFAKGSIAAKLKCLIAEETEKEAVKNMAADGIQLLEKWASNIPPELLTPIKAVVTKAGQGKTGNDLAKAVIDQLKGNVVRDAIYAACDTGKAASAAFATAPSGAERKEQLKKIIAVYDLVSMLNPEEAAAIKDVAEQAMAQVEQTYDVDIYANTQKAIEGVKQVEAIVDKIKDKIDAKANGDDKKKIAAAPDIIAEEICGMMQTKIDENAAKEKAKSTAEKDADKKKKEDAKTAEKAAAKKHTENCKAKTHYSELVQSFCC